MRSREKRRANLLLAAGALTLAAALAINASWLWRRLFPPPPPPALVKAPEPKLERLAAARALFRERLLDPKSHVGLAAALHESGRAVDAFYVLAWARELFGEEAFRRAHRFVVLYEGKDPLGGEPLDPSPAVEARLRELLKVEPKDAALNHVLALVLAARGELREATAAADRGLAAHPSQAGLLELRAGLTMRQGDSLGAVPYLARLAAAVPSSYGGRSAFDELGRLAQVQAAGQAGETARLAQAALSELNHRLPDHPKAFTALAMSAWGRGEISEVSALVSETLARNPRHAGARQVAGSLALKNLDLEGALRQFTAAWENDPEDLYSAGKLAQLHAKRGGDPAAPVRFYTALYLRDPGYDDGEPAELRVRRALAARAAELLKNTPPALLERYLRSEDASLRAEACSRAAAAADPRWTALLGELLDDDAEIVRRNADYALFRVGKSSPTAVLERRMDWLDSRRPLARLRALNVLADLDAKNTLPHALRAVSDGNPAVRYFAKTAVLDRYYRADPRAARAAAEYRKNERDPLALFLLRRKR